VADLDQLLDNINRGLQAYALDALQFPVAEELPLLPLLDHLTFARDNIPPPGALLLSADEFISVSAYNAVTGDIIRCTGRLLRPNGEVVTLFLVLSPTADRVRSFIDFPPIEGALLSFVLTPNPGGIRPGSLYAQAAIIRGAGDERLATLLLGHGYLAEALAVGWPGVTNQNQGEGRGIFRSLVGTNPAAGAEVSETVPTNARWRLVSLFAALVTSGAGAARVASLILTDPTGEAYRVQPVSTQAISLTRTYFGNSASIRPALIAAHIAWPLMPELILNEGATIATSTSNLQVDDNWGAPTLYVEEWVTP
jgi:hypothetical protein